MDVSGGKVQLNFDGSSAAELTPDENRETTWHYVCVVHDHEAQEMQLFLNGKVRPLLCLALAFPERQRRPIQVSVAHLCLFRAS